MKKIWVKKSLDDNDPWMGDLDRSKTKEKSVEHSVPVYDISKGETKDNV